MTDSKKSDFAKLEDMLKKQNVSESEAIAALKGVRRLPPTTKRISVPSSEVKYAYVSDTHIGHNKFDYALWDRAVKKINGEGVDFVVHPGDHTEGMSGRPGHIYELDAIGFQQQVDKAVGLYGQLKVPIYGINGNHDEWYHEKNNGGANVGKALEARLDNFVHLGEWEGDIDLGKGVKIRLFHANDATAYATSYKLQKLIESFSGGDKPNVVHSGHYHKALYMFSRNVHGFECGTLCGQSIFMRGRKIQAHKGFGIVKLKYNKNGVQELTHTFIPAYD